MHVRHRFEPFECASNLVHFIEFGKYVSSLFSINIISVSECINVGYNFLDVWENVGCVVRNLMIGDSVLNNVWKLI